MKRLAILVKTAALPSILERRDFAVAFFDAAGNDLEESRRAELFGPPRI